MQNFKHYFIFIILILIVSVSIYSQNNIDTIRKNKPLRILSWNIYILPAPIYPKVFKKERAVQIVDTLLKCDYDIIVFQELFQRKVRNYFYKNFANKYPYHYGPVNYKFFSLRFNGGVVVFSKFPLQLKKQFIFKACRGFEKFAKKGAMLLEGEWHNTKFQIIGTHIQAYSPQELKYKQMLEINNKYV